MIIAPAAPSRLARDVRGAMAAMVGETLNRLVWIIRECPRHAATASARVLPPLYGGLGARIGLEVLRGGGWSSWTASSASSAAPQALRSAPPVVPVPPPGPPLTPPARSAGHLSRAMSAGIGPEEPYTA